jgi:hypothetical protein
MSENKNAKTPADDGQPDAWCNGMPAYEGPLSKEQRKPLVQDLDAPLTLNGVPLYTAPPKREWVGLTLNEAEDFYEKYTDRAELINAIDKFLEEKNHV